MLQQTQVLRVIPYYLEWLARWPAVESVAEASAADVIKAWSGLGYNQRALRLRQAAVSVVSEYGGRFPADVPALRRLPGVGGYTAAAIACFASDQRVPVVDTNIARVLARSVLGVSAGKEATARRLEAVAAESLPRSGTRRHNLALMDLGATVCRARAPVCGRCPLRGNCCWLARGCPEDHAPASTPAPRFEDTARFARGRIVDALRESPSLDRPELEARLPRPHWPKLDDYLRTLQQDGLIECHLGGWRLPEIRQ